ncbi:MAG: nitroreductase family protein [Desulfovibrio sp.]
MKEIFHRVSVRRFENRAVEGDKVEQVLRAAMAAPSAGNQQPWDFYVVTSREKLQALSQVSPYAGCAADAPWPLRLPIRRRAADSPNMRRLILP